MRRESSAELNTTINGGINGKVIHEYIKKEEDIDLFHVGALCCELDCVLIMSIVWCMVEL